MKRFKNFLLIPSFVSIVLLTNAQGVVTIPVVVHVLWHDTIDNISYAQILSQMNVLYHDFRKLNPDTVLIPNSFVPFAGDAKIEFCLAQRDTNGNATTGITRTYTTVTSYGVPLNLDSISHSVLGGENSWDPTKYLNIWLGNFGGFTATSPYEFLTNPRQDGIYMPPDFFGTLGTSNNYEVGRIAVRCVGYWLNLYATGEIALGGNCFDDSISDTPPVEGISYTINHICPAFPYHANDICGTDSSGEMTMNFMTYQEGHCRNMFTNGQITRMQVCLNTMRSSLLTSDGCLPLGINELANNKNLKLYPNPTSGIFKLCINYLQRANVEIYNTLGISCFKSEIVNRNSEISVDVSDFAQGVYFVQISDGTQRFISKFVKE